MTYAFSLDASACSGCKACQEACKDKNRLSEGVLWRRVIEVTGGEWWTTGGAWETNIFAYSLSLSCNHCTHPKCAGVCPTEAFTVRPDGIVLLDPSKCMGCGYCNWACPYGAPQYDRTQGVMTKCDFCYDNLDAGLPPTCVTACPLRVLKYGSIEEFSEVKQQKNLWQLPGNEHPYPLPEYSRTEPHLAIKPHPGMSHPVDKMVDNREEILPPGSIDYNHGIAAEHELPLVVFTLLAQMAAGMAVCGLLLSSIPILALLSIGILLSLGGLISFLHLGRKRNAWRAVTHLRKSWLSREVLMAVLFTIAWATTTTWQWLSRETPSYWPLAILGLGMVYAMSRVYQLRAVPAWNTWRTPIGFVLSTINLGILAVMLFLPDPRLGWIVWFPLLVEWVLVLIECPVVHVAVNIGRFVALGLGCLGILLTVIYQQDIGMRLVTPVFIIVLAAEIIGRWLFYARRAPFPFQTKSRIQD
jgi:DMSO reductase iron-sulfur subunit